MTAPPPTKAGGAASLLASLSPDPPSPPSTVKEDFTAVMLQALGDGSDGRDGADHPAATQMAQSKPTSKGAPAPAPLTAYFLLSLLTPPKPTTTSTKATASDTADDAAVPSAPEKSAPKEAAADPSLAGLILALLAPPLPSLPKPTAHKNAALSIPVGPSAPPSPPVAAQSAGEAGAAKADEAEKTPSTVAQTLPPKEPENKPLPTSGTSAASPSPRMSFSSERNEIAGRMEQKLPPGVVSAVSSPDTGGPSSEGGAKSSLSFSWQEAPTEAVSIIDLSAKAPAVTAPLGDVTVDAPARASSTAPLEQLEKMISREVLNVRHAGAETLGVTLKLDSNTQLFLQLTTHNGAVQALVRLERGSFAPEDAHWAQLQQSLARQNVELLPMSGGSSLNFQQPSDGRSRHPAPREEWPMAGDALAPAKPRQEQKEQNRARKNWESWA